MLLGLPVLLVAIAVGPGEYRFGRHLIERQTASLTGGMVRIEGLAGRFPDALRVGRIEVSDSKGPYVTLTGVVLDWSPGKLLNRIVSDGPTIGPDPDRQPVAGSQTARRPPAAGPSPCRSRSS